MNNLNISIFLLLFFLIQCDDKKNVINEFIIGDVKLYRIVCNNELYFSLKKGDCNSLPEDYFILNGDSENYYSIFVRKKKNKLEVYSPYNDIIKKGKIGTQLTIYEYVDYRTNVFIQDSIKGKSYVISGST